MSKMLSHLPSNNAMHQISNKQSHETMPFLQGGMHESDVQCLYPVLHLAIKLAPFHVDTVLADSHTQILHRQNSSVLASALATATVSRALNTQRRAFALVLVAWLTCLLAGDGETSCGAERTHWVISVARGADAAVLVGVGGNVCDELLRGESEESRETGVGLGWWWQTGFGHVVVGDGIGNLARVSDYHPTKKKNDRATGTGVSVVLTMGAQSSILFKNSRNDVSL